MIQPAHKIVDDIFERFIRSNEDRIYNLRHGTPYHLTKENDWHTTYCFDDPWNCRWVVKLDGEIDTVKFFDHNFNLVYSWSNEYTHSGG